jgi:hypothetical protein
MPPSIKKVKKQHEVRLLQLPDVISIGIGKDENDNPAIIVGLRRPNPQTEEQIPANLEGYPVQLRIIGEIKAL